MGENLEKQVFISILFPVYNGEDFLYESIQSILNQTYRNFELLILNDGSVDNSAKIIKSFYDPRIIHLESKENKGLIYQLNKGLLSAKGKYIARMDADDIAASDRFEKQVYFMEKNVAVGVLGTQIKLFGAKSGVSNYPINHQKCCTMLLWQSCFAHPSVMIRKAIIDKYDLKFNQDYFAAEDYKFWIELMDKTLFANLSDCLLDYRVGDQNVSVKNMRVQEETKERLLIEALEKMIGVKLFKEYKRAHLLLMFPYRKYSIINWEEIKTWISFLKSNQLSVSKELLEIYHDNLLILSFFNTENGFSIFRNFINVSKDTFNYSISIKLKMFLKSILRMELKQN